MSQTFKALNTHSNSDKDILLSLTIGIVAFLVAAHLLIRSSYHGLFFSLDSVDYLSTAENLAAGKGLRDYNYNLFLWWPPLYPLLLAFLSQLGIEVQDASRVVNIVALGLVIITTGHWLNRYMKSRLLITFIVVLVATAHITNLIALFTISETLFTLLLLLALVHMDKFLTNNFPITALIISAIFALIASMTRYAGIAIIATAIFLIIVDWKLSLVQKLRYSIVYVVISLIPVLIYLSYSLLSSFSRFFAHQNLSRRRLDAAEFIPFYLKQLIEMLQVWFFVPEPGNIHAWASTVEEWTGIEHYTVKFETPIWAIYYLWIVAGVIILATSISIGRYIKAAGSKQQLMKNPVIWRPIDIKALLIPISFTAIYLLMLLTPFKGSQIINYRYLSPIYIPILVCFTFMVRRFYRKETLRQATVAKSLLATLLVLGCIVHINRIVRWNTSVTAKTLEYSNYQPYIQSYGPNSPIIEYLNTNTMDGNILANYTPIIYQMTNLPSPVRHLGCSYWSNNSAEIREGKLEHDYIILLTKTSTYDTYCDLRAMALQQYQQHLDLILETSDGLIYRVTK